MNRILKNENLSDRSLKAKPGKNEPCIQSAGTDPYPLQKCSYITRIWTVEEKHACSRVSPSIVNRETEGIFHTPLTRQSSSISIISLSFGTNEISARVSFALDARLPEPSPDSPIVSSSSLIFQLPWSPKVTAFTSTLFTT